MKHIEYACYDYSLNEIETENNILSAVKAGVNSVSVFSYSLNNTKNLLQVKEKKILVSCPVDFPYGLSDPKSRSFMVSQLCKAGVDSIDLFIPTKIISNRKYDKFRDDVKNNLEICNEHNVKLRYVLEYRVYSHEVLAKVCQILLSFGIDTIFPSSGMMIDDINDNLIACNFLHVKSKIKTISTANCYSDKHYKIINNTADLYGIRFFHISSLNSYIGTTPGK